MTIQPSFNVCFASDTQVYVVKRYKSYTWARKYVATDFRYYAIWRGCNQWAIERIMPEDQWGQTCVIATSKNWVHPPRFRNRSEADRWVKGEEE
jgi:hypothetical protein